MIRAAVSDLAALAAGAVAAALVSFVSPVLGAVAAMLTLFALAERDVRRMRA